MNPTTRRTWLKSTAVGAGVLATAPAINAADDDTFKATGKNIKQSVMGWCFKSKPNPISNEDLAKHCAAMGMKAMEGVSPKTYPLIKKLGMDIAITGGHGFKAGPSDPNNHEMCETKLREGIDRAVEFGCKSVITFTGMRVKGMDDEEGFKNCVNLWKKVIGYAEKKKVNLCLEHLNSRDDTHPMKGHPGYLGDDVDQCTKLIAQVGSPNMKLLFDIYHVQIMNGDVIRRIRQYKDIIGHYHTAGNPGRAELDDTQEINYPPIMRAIVETGYKGFVAQEFIPTWEDKIKALRHAVKLCDV